MGSEFTKNQKFTIEELKEHRRRDHKLDLFLSEQERRPECRRLQLQAMLPCEHQRLVKYPLLLEQLAKQMEKRSSKSKTSSAGEAAAIGSSSASSISSSLTLAAVGGTISLASDEEDSNLLSSREPSQELQELTTVKRCVERTREILDSIDKQVAEAQNIQRLAEIQRNLDTSGLEKMPDSAICAEYRVSGYF